MSIIWPQAHAEAAEDARVKLQEVLARVCSASTAEVWQAWTCRVMRHRQLTAAQDYLEHRRRLALLKSALQVLHPALRSQTVLLEQSSGWRALHLQEHSYGSYSAAGNT